MAGEAATRVRRRWGAVMVPPLVLLIVVVVGVTSWAEGDLNRVICDGDCGPANVIAPHGLTSRTHPATASPPQASAAAIDPVKLAAAVGPALASPVLGEHVGFSAVDPAGGAELAPAGSGTYVPASVTKVLTSFAALSTIDPQTRFSTTTVAKGDQVVLVGGGDPYLAVKRAEGDDRAIHADLTTLARRTAAAVRKAGRTTVRLGYDASAFSGPTASPTWEPGYVTGNIVTPVSALWADQGVTGGVRAADPAAAAARTFARLLGDRGITVTGEPSAVKAPAGATTAGRVRSATVAQIVETLIRTSDNQAAEVMLRHAAIAAGRPATFDGGTEAVRAALTAAGVDTSGLQLHDGSGLSREDRIAPRTLAETLRTASLSSRTSSLVSDLPVSGFTGTLVDRFATLKTALGTVRAKTGTLTGVHSLAGYAVDADGRAVFFALMADHADKGSPLPSQAALDQVAAAIAACHCSS